MRIIYCIAKTHNSGGMERVLANKANYLIDQGHEIIIITTDQCGKQPYFPLDARIRCYDLGINYEENNGASFGNKLIHYPFKQIRHKKRLGKLLKQLKADIVISMFCNDASFITDINDGSKKIVEIHFSKFKRLQYGRKGIWKMADWYRTKADEKLVKKFDRFVVLTQEDKGYWGNLPNMEVIHNMLSFHSKEIAPLENKRVLAIGRYTYQKGFDYLLDAWKIVHREKPDWTLDIVGDGELQAQLQEQIFNNQLDSSVCLRPPTKKIEDIYKEASILVMSSRYEGLPMVLLEAESCGLPVVSFTCKCGPKDIVTDGMDGFLVPEADIDTLANRILLLMEDDKLRRDMGKAAKENSERFSEIIIMKEWIKLFENLILER